MDQISVMMRKIKDALPEEKRTRIVRENDGRSEKIIIKNNLDGINPSNSQISEKEIAEIEALGFEVCDNKFYFDEFLVKVKAN